MLADMAVVYIVAYMFTLLSIKLVYLAQHVSDGEVTEARSDHEKCAAGAGQPAQRRIGVVGVRSTGTGGALPLALALLRGSEQHLHQRPMALPHREHERAPAEVVAKDSQARIPGTETRAEHVCQLEVKITSI